VADLVLNPYPQPWINPDEPGLIAGYTPHCDNELAQWGRVLNRASSGAVYDLPVRIGTPLIGQGGGILGAAGSAWRYAGVVPVGNTNLSYTTLVQYDVVGAAWTMATRNGGHYAVVTTGGGDRPNCSFDGGGTSSGPAYPIVGRGPVWFDALYDGVNQIAVCNGVQADIDAVVPNIGAAATLDTGYVGTTRLFKVYNIRRTVAQARAQYVREFAKKVLFSWAPRDVGEGPAGGILTGSTPGGYATCPLGAATMQFVWRPDLSHPAGGRLCLTDSAVGAMNRIDIEYGNRPWFGSWLIEYEIRDPATDSLIVGWTPRRGIDPTLAGSNAYWAWIRTAAGPWWRSSLYLANGAQIDAADAPWPGPVAGNRCKMLVTRDVDGTIQTWTYVPTPTAGWWWSTVTGNDVTVLNEGCLTIAPRGPRVERITWYQGAMTPHELESTVL